MVFTSLPAALLSLYSSSAMVTALPSDGARGCKPAVYASHATNLKGELPRSKGDIAVTRLVWEERVSSPYCLQGVHAVTYLAEALCFKPEGRGFLTR
jgi:hypothetical protein